MFVHQLNLSSLQPGAHNKPANQLGGLGVFVTCGFHRYKFFWRDRAILFAAGAGAGSGAQAAAAVAAISTAIAMISLVVIGAIVAEVATATTTSNNG